MPTGLDNMEGGAFYGYENVKVLTVRATRLNSFLPKIIGLFAFLCFSKSHDIALHATAPPVHQAASVFLPSLAPARPLHHTVNTENSISIV